ncbi:hypothetical protein ACKFKF_12595 [Phormidesmis sp. 146-12]
MSQTPQQPEPLDTRITNLERDMSDLRVAAEALLQTAQIHQQNFEAITTELQISRQNFETLRQRQVESDQRFEILLAELRQLRIDSNARFNEIQNRPDSTSEQDEG